MATHTPRLRAAGRGKPSAGRVLLNEIATHAARLVLYASRALAIYFLDKLNCGDPLAPPAWLVKGGRLAATAFEVTEHRNPSETEKS